MSDEYRVTYYKKSSNGEEPARDFIRSLDLKSRAKVRKYIEYLKESDGHLDQPYSKHIEGKIRELRVDFAHNRHRIFYFTFVNKNIILLSGFLKKTDKAPRREIEKALEYYEDVVNHQENYE